MNKMLFLTFSPLFLIGMSDSRPNTMPNTPELRPYSPAILESHYATQDIRIVNVTPEEEATFLQSIQAAHDRENQSRLRDIESQVQKPAPQNSSVAQTVANNKTLILSNLTTALLGATVTLIVHFTAA
jgi:hypothetical protein